MKGRIAIVGGPLRGKSTYAAKLASLYRLPVYCGDPKSTVRVASPDVTYVPEGLPFRGAGGVADFIAREWLVLPGPWVVEGHAVARALRRYVMDGPPHPPADQIFVMVSGPYAAESERQRAMARAVETVWSQIKEHPFFRGKVEFV